MPIVTLTLRKPKTPDFKTKVLEAVHAALVQSGVRTTRTDDFVLIEVLLGAGRSVKVKKQILSGIVERLAAQGLDPENVMVVFQDVPWENWSPAGGRMPHG